MTDQQLEYELKDWQDGKRFKEQPAESDQLISDMDDLRLTYYEAMREMYEQKRDYYQLLMDTTDKLILEIQKKKVKQ